MNSGASQQCPPDSPLMKAWNAYQETDDFKNSLIWATAENYRQAGTDRAGEPDKPFTDIQREQFAKGSLWAAFMQGFKMAGAVVQNPWQHVPGQYKGRWGYDYDEKNNVFFVHCGGHRICDAEDSEVADAICRAHNTQDHLGL